MSQGARQLALGLTALLALACSRAKEEQIAPSAAPPEASRAALTPGSTPIGPTGGTPALPTPEDEEEDSAHRITEQNLESELDRLEREIQAE